MIPIRQYNDYFSAMLGRGLGIKRFLLAATETDLSKNLMNLSLNDFPILVAIIPSTDSIATDMDNILGSNACLLYILQKIDPTSVTPDNFLTDMETLQDVMLALQEKMSQDKAEHVAPHFMHRLDMNRMHTDPEYNYLGCNGWSVSFNLLSPYFS